jgi:hypothetical protein
LRFVWFCRTATPLPQADDRLLKTIATAREWWKQLMADPKLRIADLAAANAMTESWVTRVLRLAFLDPAIVQQIIAGTAPVALTFDSLRAPDAVPGLWSAQRALHQGSASPAKPRGGKLRAGKFGRERKGDFRAQRAQIPYRRAKCIAGKPADTRGLRTQAKARRFSAD